MPAKNSSQPNRPVHSVGPKSNGLFPALPAIMDSAVRITPKEAEIGVICGKIGMTEIALSL
jgi:hypothetical protein